jgi:hypothetical protein
MSTVPHELNWVQIRAACTIEQIFNKLCNDFEGDVSAINAVRNLLHLDRFKIDKVGDGSTIVIGQPSRFPRTVVKIGVVDNEIEVQDDTTRNAWRVGIGLNNEGRCILRLNEKTELEQWQFRKMALENLFFDMRAL